MPENRKWDEDPDFRALLKSKRRDNLPALIELLQRRSAETGQSIDEVFEDLKKELEARAARQTSRKKNDTIETQVLELFETAPRQGARLGDSARKPDP
jgi:hypothetical protein